MSAQAVQLGVLLPTRGVLLSKEGPPDVRPVFRLAEQAEEQG